MSGAIPTIAEAARLIAAKRLSPVEMTRALGGNVSTANYARCDDDGPATLARHL